MCHGMPHCVTFSTQASLGVAPTPWSVEKVGGRMPGAAVRACALQQLPYSTCSTSVRTLFVQCCMLVRMLCTCILHVYNLCRGSIMVQVWVLAHTDAVAPIAAAASAACVCYFSVLNAAAACCKLRHGAAADRHKAASCTASGHMLLVPSAASMRIQSTGQSTAWTSAGKVHSRPSLVCQHA